ncbi:MAG: ABC transporter ATP-binding protein, partial [candidate division Zixibacteria bacterium]
MTSDFYQDEQISREERDTKLSVAFAKLLPFLKEHRRGLAICLALLVLATGLSLVWPYLVMDAIDGPIAAEMNRPTEQRDFTPLLWIGLIIVISQIATLVLQYVQRVKLEIIGQDVMLKLKQRLFDHILSQNVDFFDKHPVGRLLARVESDTESLRLLFTNTVVMVVGDLILMIGIYLVMGYNHFRLALAMAAMIPLLALLIWIFHRLTTHRFMRVRKLMAEITATITEFLHGMSIVQIFHRGDYARSRVYRVNERKFAEDAYVNISVCIFFNLLFFLEYVKIGMVLLLGSMWNISAGIMVLYIVLIWREFDPIARTADQLGSFQKGLAGARRIFALLSEAPKLTDVAVPTEWKSLTDSIRFEN